MPRAGAQGTKALHMSGNELHGPDKMHQFILAEGGAICQGVPTFAALPEACKLLSHRVGASDRTPHHSKNSSMLELFPNPPLGSPCNIKQDQTQGPEEGPCDKQKHKLVPMPVHTHCASNEQSFGASVKQIWDTFEALFEHVQPLKTLGRVCISMFPGASLIWPCDECWPEWVAFGPLLEHI